MSKVLIRAFPPPFFAREGHSVGKSKTHFELFIDPAAHNRYTAPKLNRMEFTVMNLDRFRTLLKDARAASDPRSGGLLDYRDLQQLLGRVAAEASALLDQCDAMGSRLTRNPRKPADDLVHYAAESMPVNEWTQP